MEPRRESLACDDHGPLIVEDLLAQATQGARFTYLLPNFQNPTGRTMGEARRVAVDRPPALPPGRADAWKTTPTATSGSTKPPPPLPGGRAGPTA
jgi:hypothetical protein